MTTALPLDLLANFTAVAEEGSFSKAARRIGVSKGTVSRALARLEARLGMELVHRTTHEVALSTAGLALYERTAPHVTALRDAACKLPELDERPSGLLRLTAPHDFATIVLPAILAQFARRYPEVSIDLRVTNARLDLVAERVDLAIRVAMGKMRDSSLTVRGLGGAGASFFAAPSYLARRGEPSAFADPAHDWVVMPPMARWFRAPRSFRPRALVDDMQVVARLLREGLGVGVLPEFIARQDVAEGALARVTLTDPMPSGRFVLVHPSRGQVPRKVAAFRDFLVEQLKARPLGA